MFFALTATIIALVTYIFATVFGMVLMPSAVLLDNRNEEDKEFIALLSPILGTAVWLAAIISLGLIMGYTAPLLYTLFTIAFVFIYLKREKIFIPKAKFYWIFLIIITVVAFVSCCSIAPLEFDGKIYIGSSIYDHVKVALIDSIANFGLPPRNPWIADNGIPVNVVYYYGLHAFAAQLTILTGLSGYMADTSLVLGFSVFISTSTILALSLKLAQRTGLNKPQHKKFLFIAFCLMYFSARLSVYFDLLPQGIKSAFYPANLAMVGFWPLLINCMWTSQHYVAATFTVLIIYLYDLLLACNEKKSVKELTIFIGIIASAAIMTSIYAGAFPFVFLLVAFVFVYIRNSKFREDFNSKLPSVLWAVVIAFIIVFPYVLHIFIDLKEAPVAFGVQPTYGDSFRGGFLPLLKYILSFYFIVLPKHLGLFYVFGLGFVIVHIFNPKMRQEQDRLLLFGKLLAITTLIIIVFVHSTFYSNDFGWRTSEPTSLFLYAFSTLCLTKIFVSLYESKKKIVYALVVFITIIQAVALFYPKYDSAIIIHTNHPELRETFTKAVKGWERVREVTDKKDLVLSNPSAFGVLTGGSNTAGNCVDVFFSCYARRNTPVSIPIFSWCYSMDYDLDKLNARFDRVVKFFEGAPDQNQVNYIIDDLKVKAILVTPVDGLWKNEGKLLTRYKKVFSTADYKVFVAN
ncbi:MAG: hypothetical protein Q4C78_05470 [Synergistaceae bacterium]|nr:hypothetical protein [Synergistaceae bacterium]